MPGFQDDFRAYLTRLDRERRMESCRQFRTQIVAELQRRADEIERPFNEAQGWGAKVGLFHKKSSADSLRHVATIIESIEPNA